MQTEANYLQFHFAANILKQNKQTETNNLFLIYSLQSMEGNRREYFERVNE
jgi:hypothetical protein